MERASAIGVTRKELTVGEQSKRLDEPAEVIEAGLCASCRHAERISGARSVFWLCGRSRSDPSFPRYPGLPVLRCRGYTMKLGTGTSEGKSDGEGTRS